MLLLQYKQERALLRINGRGTEELIDRHGEVETMVALSRAGLCCPLYCQFENGICYGYAPGRPLLLEDVKEGEEEERQKEGGKGGEMREGLARKVMANMARLHSLPCPVSVGEKELLLWGKYNRWLDALPSKWDKNTQFASNIGSLELLKSESRWMQQETAKTHSPLVFCHSDLNKPNVIFDEPTNSVAFVDFEYAGPNYLAFELANWLCETELELERYPSESYCRWWIEMYIEETEQLRWASRRSDKTQVREEAARQVDQEGPKSEEVHRETKPVEVTTTQADTQGLETVTEAEKSLPPSTSSQEALELDCLHREVSLFSLASHLLWCVWALHQATHSEVTFDFMGYAILRHSLFVKYRAQFACDI